MPGLLRGIARTAAIAGTATAVSNRVSRRQAGRWAAKEHKAAASAGAPAGEEHARPRRRRGPDEREARSAQGSRRVEGAGVLTEAEFEEQKRRILG